MRIEQQMRWIYIFVRLFANCSQSSLSDSSLMPVRNAMQADAQSFLRQAPTNEAIKPVTSSMADLESASIPELPTFKPLCSCPHPHSPAFSQPESRRPGVEPWASANTAAATHALQSDAYHDSTASSITIISPSPFCNFPSRIKFDFHADTACCANNHPYRFHLAFSLLQPPRCLSRASCQSLLIERVNIAIIRAFWNGSLQNCRQSGGPAFLAPICCKSGALCSWSCVFRQVSMVMQWLKTPQSAINRMVNVHVYRGMLVFRSRAHLYNSLSEPQSTILTACTQTPRKKSSRPMKRPEVPTAPQ